MLLSRGIEGNSRDGSGIEGNSRDGSGGKESGGTKNTGTELRIDDAGNVYAQRQIRIECGTIGKVIDAGVKDSNQMGSAKAPAALDTILTQLEETGRTLDHYDLVCTGDLGFIGKSIVRDLLEDAGVSRKMIADVYDDCGAMIYAPEQDIHSGGSGCGCSATVFSSYILPKLEDGTWKRVLFLPTGALLSKVSFNEGRTIPGVAQAVVVESAQEEK